MPTIYDTIQTTLLDGLQKLLPEAKGVSICVGYLNLRAWSHFCPYAGQASPEKPWRLPIGMYPPARVGNAASGLQPQLRRTTAQDSGA